MKNKDEALNEIPRIHPAPTAPIESSSGEDYEEYSSLDNTTSNDASSEDERARQQAARHRQDAQNLVRDHLRNHAQHNPGASSDYVTWIATLHPENADITIDRRFFVPGNAWWSIYEETKNTSTVVPVAEAVPVSNDGASKNEEDLEKEGESSYHDLEIQQPNWCQTCNPIALSLGLAIILLAIGIVVALELLALVAFYLPSCFLHHSGQAFAPPNICTVVLYAFFMILYWGFWLADYMVLLSSVLVTECLGMAALAIGFFTGGCLWARQLHQYLRRVGHCVRVQFRKPKQPQEEQTRHCKRRKRCSSRTTMPTRGLSWFAQRNNYRPKRQEAMRVITVERERNDANESLH